MSEHDEEMQEFIDECNRRKDIKDQMQHELLSLNVRDQRIVLSQLGKTTDKISKREAIEKEEQHLVWTVVCDAYKHMLEYNKSAKECLEYSARKHIKDIDKVLSEKSKNVGTMPRKVVKKHDDHPVQKDMIKRGKFERQAMANSKNIWQMLNLLSHFRAGYEDLLRTEAEIKGLKTTVAIQQLDIDRLKKSTNMPELTDKEKAVLLKDMGYTYEQLAEMFGRSVRTIKYWVKDK